MKFWDSSALVPLLLAEPRTGAMRTNLEEDDQVVVFWTTEVECASAIARCEREASLGAEQVAVAFERLDTLRATWTEVQSADAVRDTARRLLRTHPLRTADSLQLAAALVVSEYRPSSLPFVCLDARLGDAAAREGFPVRTR